MSDTILSCLAERPEGVRPLHAVRPDGLAALLERLPAAESSFLRAVNFTAAAQELALLNGPDGLSGAVLGLGEDRSSYAFGGLALRLPERTVWRLEPGAYDEADAVLGFCLGAYQFTRIKPAKRAPARLFVAPGTHRQARAEAAAVAMVRDLVNLPANLLGPAELARFAVELGARFGAETTIIEAEELEREYPTVAAVGRGSARAPLVATLRWTGSGAHADAPLVALCGKGVCFDSGGYDLKPSAGMLRMKKDMGGAATVLGLARLIMEADLPLRLLVRIGCVENSVSGTAMRPLDVIRTRAGISVEIGNTDAEGRLVLCDLLAACCEESPALLLDCATLTGAARVALGPDLPALFCNDEAWAAALIEAGAERTDPLWRLPLWDGYDNWLDSTVADIGNVSTKPAAGAITAALFLRRFVTKPVNWAHYDLYAWNDQTRPGRPEGGEAQVMRGAFTALSRRLLASEMN